MSERYFTITPVARQIPFDNSTNGFTGSDVQSAIEEVKTSASPGFTFGRSGTLSTGSYLLNENVPSSSSGRVVALNNALIRQVFIANEDPSIFSLRFIYHDGNLINTVVLGTVTTAAQRTNSFPVSWPVPFNKQIAVFVFAASAKNVVVGLQLSGNII